MRRKALSKLCTAVAVAGLAVLASAMPASAGGKAVVSPPIAEHPLAGPLQFEVEPNGTILVGQSFSGTVSSIGRDGKVTDLFNDPGVDGVSAGAFGTVIYTHTDPDAGVAELRLRTPFGQTKTIASTLDYEKRKNPDQGQTYGLIGLTDECAAQLPPDLAKYTGIVDSHPYAVTPVPFGWLVADAAGNDILFVDWFGGVHTAAVLPPQPPVLVTAGAAEANGLPPCVVGSSFVAEPVPTDVEVGRDFNLYVSTLPGGPEDPSLGARGGVYQVNPFTGRTTQIATGLAGANEPGDQPQRHDLRVRAVRRSGVQDRPRHPCPGRVRAPAVWAGVERRQAVRRHELARSREHPDHLALSFSRCAGS